MNWANALAIAEKGFETWAAKDHNRKWVRKIDGTPIKNDLLVNIATAFAEAHVQPAPIAGLEPVAWQPIKTAPRDGTPILCFTPDYQSEFSDQSGIDVLWFDGGAWLYNAVPVTFQPTHWMPLPASPNFSSSGYHTRAQLEAHAAEQVRPLVEALKATLEEIERVEADVEYSLPCGDKARAAIAKAEGSAV